MKPAPSSETPTSSGRQNVCLPARAAALTIIAILIGGYVVDASALNVTVQPTELVIAAKLNEPIVLRLEVTTTNSAANIDLKSNGLRIQREIENVDSTHRVFLIEPDTSEKGQVNGQIEVVDSAGGVLCAVPVTGEVQPYIHVLPARIFLGSLEYGMASAHILKYRIRLSADSTWEISGVDASEMPEARWTIKNEDAATKVLLLQFSEDAFKANAPFGAFIKRTIRLKTNNAGQPELFVIIEGMLSRNATKRNFNTFVFKGNERWQGKWSSPNLAAAVLGPIVLLVLGYGAWLTRVQTKYPLLWRIVAAGLCFCAVVGMILLARTYSRGGWMAFGAGLGLMIALMKRHKNVLGTGAVVFILIVVFLPAGMQRAASASAISEDQSIHHRLLVWRGALEMIADHLVRGVGTGQFGEIFQNYYQEPWHKDKYATAISDYLTFAAERGIIPVLLVIGSVVCLMTVAVGYLRRYGDIWVAPVVCALLALGVSSIFSSIEFIWEVRALASMGVGTLVIYCGVRVAHEQGDLRNIEKVVENVWLRGTCAGATAICFSGAAVACAAWMRPASYCVQQNALGAGHGPARIEYFPGSTVPQRGTLLVLSASQEPLTAVGRQVLRPLAENGWRAVALDLCIYDQEAAGQVAAALHDLAGPTLILAEGTRARVAVRALQLLDLPHRPKLIFVDPVFFSALRECNQSNARETTLSVAVISGERWHAFKRDGRSGLSSLIQTCEVSARRSSAPGLDGLLNSTFPQSGSATVQVNTTGQ